MFHACGLDEHVPLFAGEKIRGRNSTTATEQMFGNVGTRTQIVVLESKQRVTTVSLCGCVCLRFHWNENVFKPF